MMQNHATIGTRRRGRRYMAWFISLAVSVGSIAMSQFVRLFQASAPVLQSDSTRSLASVSSNGLSGNVSLIRGRDTAATMEKFTPLVYKSVSDTLKEEAARKQKLARMNALVDKINKKQWRAKSPKVKRKSNKRKKRAEGNPQPTTNTKDDVVKRYNQTSFIDFISVGSLTKPQLQAAQIRTFGSHSAVRHFFPMTELNDTDSTCYKDLTMVDLETAVEFCKDVEGQSHESKLLRKKLRPFQYVRKSTGWLCAQKRPLDGLHLVLDRYKTESLPSYLIIMDDDSYFNMNPLVGTLHNAHPPDELFVLSGCTFTFPKEIRFNFPYGGFGSILTRKAIQNLMRPIYCNATKPDGFTRMACWRLNQNLVGEQKFFRNGMTVADLMHAFSSGLPFTGVDDWDDGVGFCFHSDHAIAYFVGYYHVGVPDYLLEKSKVGDWMRKSNDFSFVNIGFGNQCDYEKDECTDESMICHLVQPFQMDQLFHGELPGAADVQ